MVEINSSKSELVGEESLIAAAKQLVEALEINKNLSDDTRKILAELGFKLSSITCIPNKEKRVEEISDVIGEFEERFNAIQERVTRWETDPSMIWDSGPEEAFEYLNAVKEAQKLIEELENSLSIDNDDQKSDLLQRTHDVLQMSMARLEEEFTHILVQNRQPFEPDHTSFRSTEEDISIPDESSIISFEEDSVNDVPRRGSLIRGNSEEYVIDLIRPDAIFDLKRIAALMFDSNYDRECSQAFVCMRKDALDECLHVLEIEKLSIEDVLKMEWAGLNSRIKRWVWAMKIFVRIYLYSEKRLHDQLFGHIVLASSCSFVEASKASILQLLNFGEAVAVSPHKPEKLFGILDMYEGLADLLPNIQALYSDESGSCVIRECHEVLNSLGDSVRATFLDFESAIASNASTNPFAGGGIHHLTRYVMNFVRNLTDYRKSLDFLLRDYVSFSTSPTSGCDASLTSLPNASSMTLNFHTLISILETNLECKSKLYRDGSLQHFFLMNNLHYMVQKVKSSELRGIFGDEWIKRHIWKFRQHAMKYERATWSSILPLLKEDGISNHNSSTISTILFRDRLRAFYQAFEDVYKIQSGWLIVDLKLREDLRISTSLNVIQAYRYFVGRNSSNICERHVKYTADDLENYLLDFFEGSQRSLQNCHRR